MRVATIIAHRNTPKLADHMAHRMKTLTKVANVENRVLIMDCGGYPKKRTRHPSYWYPDPKFEYGKIKGHVEGVKLLGDDYDYYWLNHPDLIFNDEKTLQTLIRVMEENPEIGLLSPRYNMPYSGMLEDGPDPDWHKVSCVEYLSFFIRGKAMKEVGCLDVGFSYCAGTDLDYGYRMWEKGWNVGFCDKISMHHLGGTTYGAPGTNTMSRQHYLWKSCALAFQRLTEKYGKDWSVYMSRVLPDDVLGNHIKFCWDNRILTPEVVEIEK